MDDDKTPPEDQSTKAGDGLPPTETALPGGTSSPGQIPLPDSVAQYRILGKLGEGGMGVVYEAQQEHPKRKVAIKVVRGGQFVDEHRVRMFQREADTLARLKHPSIGGIYDSGRTEDGQHFFAMELVRGDTLDRYLNNRPTILTPQELRLRLTLFLKIADAVHYAHQRGVIHRDLKPSNIVVTEEAASEDSRSTISGLRLPEIKILDFGLARITQGDVASATLTTEVGAIKGTLPYMSPEQARGNPDEIDLRTDVYALGVILYEMLTGRRPYDVLKKSLVEAVRVICEEPPRALAETWSGVRKLDPDVETVVGRALEKDADRRYASAAALSDDVSRYLTSQPILARPPSTMYQLRKFAGRNRALVGGIAATFVALLAGAVVSILFGVQAQMQREAALKEAETAKHALGFMTGMFEVSDPSEARGNSITAREILDKGAKEIDESLSDQPEVQARLMGAMGSVYRTLGLYEQAEALLERALATRKRVLGDDHPDTLNSMTNLAILYESQGRYDEALPLYLECLAARRRVLGDDHPNTLGSMSNLANVYYGQGRYDEAEPLQLETLESCKRVLGDDHSCTYGAMNNLAILYKSQGRYDEAEPLYLESLETYKRVLGDDHPDTLSAMNNLAILYKSLGRYDEAEPLYLETLEVQKRVLGDDHPDTLDSMGNLAILYHGQGRYDEAEKFFLESLEARIRMQGEDHPHTLLSMNSLANLYGEQGRYDEARQLLERAVASNHADPVCLHSLGELLLATGDLKEAEVYLRQAVEAYESRGGDEFLGLALYQLTGLAARHGKRAEALALLRRAAASGHVDESVANDSNLVSLHGDPEFEAIVAEVKKRIEEE